MGFFKNKLNWFNKKTKTFLTIGLSSCREDYMYLYAFKMKGNMFYMLEKILLQGIFLTQGSNPGLLHCRQTPCCLSHPGKSYILEKIQNIDIKGIQKRETFLSEMTREDCLEEASFEMHLEE